MRRVYSYGLGEKVYHIGARWNNLSEFWASAEECSSCDKRMNANSSDACNFLPKERHEKLFPFSHAVRSLLLSLSGTQHTGVLYLLGT